MTRRPRTLEMEETMYTGEILSTKTKELDSNKEHELKVQKLQVASEVTQIGSKIVDIFHMNANAKAKAGEIDSKIKQLEAETKAELDKRLSDREDLKARSQAIVDITSPLMTQLLQANLSKEQLELAKEMIDSLVDKALKNE
ncbi:hypothetical protein P8864_11510 [Priestia flexa]|uniref:hypothetical protein n=1 Tax=Priestia flexa TaxID=86664 RepID=UPI000C23610E|nr:hypothetical protein [Priestia flexa]MEC0666514.1 hypothetical protein [Priestia flexa]